MFVPWGSGIRLDPFSVIISLNLHASLHVWYYYLHFTEEDTVRPEKPNIVLWSYESGI